MSKKEVLRRVRKIADSIAGDLNYELVDLEYVKENGRFFLRVYIHKDGGVNLDDCQNMSEKLSSKLDEDDPIKDTYYLEVSSPGLDRPLKTDRDLERNLGKDIELNLYSPLEGKKNYEAKLIDYSKDYVKIEEDNEHLVEIPREQISKIKLAIKF